jgi:hypothetical protein
MGITDKFEIDGLSIKDYAMLPQQEILKRAQMGRLPPTLVSVILNEKAQMAQAAANAKALAQQRPVQSVTENNMQINAQADAEAMVPQQVAGIESLPIREDMFDETSLAGGGIVAFEDGGAVPRYQGQGMVAFPRFEDLPKAPGDAVVPGSGLSSFFKGLSTKDLRVDPVTGEPVSFGEYMRRLDERRAKANVSFGKSIADSRMPPDVESGEYADRMLKAAGVEYTKAPPATKTPAKVEAPAETPTEDIMARRMRMLKEAGVSSDLEKELAENAAAKESLVKDRSLLDALTMVKAGLGIAGGSSPYALQNISGALPALESYEKGLRGIKEDKKEYAKIERDLRRADQALKRGDVDKALELEDKAAQRAIQLRGIRAQEAAAAKTPGEIQLIERYAKDRGISFSQALKEISGVKAEPKARDEALKKWSDSLLLQKKYPNFEDFYATTRGAGGGGAGWGDLRVKQ